MIPVANHLPLRRTPRRVQPLKLLAGLLIGFSFTAGFVAAAHWLARK